MYKSNYEFSNLRLLDKISFGYLTPNPFYVIYRHELSRIIRELAINGAKVEIFDIRGKMVISHMSIVKFI